MLDGLPAGAIFWSIGPAGDEPSEAEITALLVERRARGQGIGRGLLDGAAEALRASGVSRIWLVTTNDNVPAIELYRKAGFEISAERPGAIDEYRRTIKPTIPELGEGGIPMRDEIELDRPL